MKRSAILRRADTWASVPAFKPKKCKVCKEEFRPVKKLQAVCGILCSITLGRAQKTKAAAKAAKADRKETREKLEKLKTRSEYLKDAQQAFNAFIRARDKAAGHACISSGKPLDWSGNEVDAGHYRSTGAAKHLRFTEDNCHAQAKRENRYLAGNAVDYRRGLIERIGLERVEALEADNTVRRWTIDDLKQIIATYRKKTKELTR